MLGRARLNDSLFISMSNYYYDEKNSYLKALTSVRSKGFDLTDFIKFGLKGISLQCKRMLREVNRHVAKSLFRDVMAQMYGRLMSTRKRALAERQMAILDRLLDVDEPMDYLDLYKVLEPRYEKLSRPVLAYVRDLNELSGMEAIRVTVSDNDQYFVKVRLEWGTEVTRTSFYEQLDHLPKAKTRLMVSPRV